MKKLFSSVCLAALLCLGTPHPAQSMPMLFGALKGNNLANAVTSTQVSTHSTVAAQSTFTWNTVNFGTANPTRKIGIFVTTRVASGSPALVSSATIGGVTAHNYNNISNTLNNIAFIIADVPTGTTNQTVTVNLSTTAAQASIICYSILDAAFLEPTATNNGTTDNVALGTYVHANGVLLCGMVAQSNAGGATWTNATEDVDANYTGTTWHSSASFTTVAEVTSHNVTVDEAGTVTDLARIQVSFQPLNGKPFSRTSYATFQTGSNRTSYSTPGLFVGAPAAGRRVSVNVCGYNGSGQVSGITVNGAAAQLIYRSNGQTLLGWYIAEVATGTTVDVVTSFNVTANAFAIAVTAIYGLTSTTPYNVSAGVVGSGAKVTSVNVPQDGIVMNVTGLLDDAGQTVTYTNLTETLEFGGTNSTYVSVGCDNRQNAATGRNITTQWTGSNTHRAVSASFI